MKYTYSVTLERFLRMGDSTFLLGEHYPLVMGNLGHVTVELSDIPGDIPDADDSEDTWESNSFKFQPIITVEDWSTDRYISEDLKESLNLEIQLAEIAENSSFLKILQMIIDNSNVRLEEISIYDAVCRYPPYHLSKDIVMDMVSGGNVAFFISHAAQSWIASDDPILYLNFMSAGSMAKAWQEDAFKDAAFVALLSEVKDLPDSANGLGKQAETLYRRARGRDVGGGRPLHHLTRFVSNVQKREDEYAVNPLGSGVQALLMHVDSDPDLEQLPMSMSLTLPQGRPVLNLSFRPVAAFTPEALITHAKAVNRLLKDFYVRASETLAFFDDLGQLIRAEARVIDECPVFCFEITGHLTPSVPYADDEVLQTHLLLNLGETFTQRRLLKKIHGLLND